jgi:energy-coupling factor transporter ATP-binding protein EcfA2
LNAISIRKVGFSYRDEPVLSAISLDVRQGEFVGLLGPVGCGKTTLLLAMNGIIPNLVKGKFSGEVLVMGESTRKRSVQQLSRHVAFVFQDPNDQIFNLTCEEEVAFGLENRGVRGEELERRVGAALSAVGLAHKRREDPCELSEGQKQLLCIASAIAMDTPIILLDEPTSSLDNRSAEMLYSILHNVNRTGKTVVVVGHRLEEMARHATRFVVMKNGRIAAMGGKAVLKKL